MRKIYFWLSCALFLTGVTGLFVELSMFFIKNVQDNLSGWVLAIYLWHYKVISVGGGGILHLFTLFAFVFYIFYKEESKIKNNPNILDE